jgi:hypothetical protein
MGVQIDFSIRLNRPSTSINITQQYQPIAYAELEYKKKKPLFRAFLLPELIDFLYNK